MGSAGRFLTADEYRALWLGILRGECGFEGSSSEVDALVVTRRRRRGWRGLALVALLGEMGLRIGEAVAVRWEALAGALKGSPVVQLPAGICKGKRARQVIGTPAAVWALGVWRSVLQAESLNDYAEQAAVVEYGAQGLGVRGGQKMIERFGRRYVGRQVGCHDLRRTFGDRIRRVSDVRIAQLMLGHERLASTERYLAGSLAERLDAAVRIDGVLWPDGFRAASPAGGAAGEWGTATQIQALVDTSGRS